MERMDDVMNVREAELKEVIKINHEEIAYWKNKANNSEEELDQVKRDNKQLEEENKKLKSDLSECECSMHFENDEVGYRKRECKKLKEENKKLNEKIRFLEECLDNKEKVNKKLREELKQRENFRKNFSDGTW